MCVADWSVAKQMGLSKSDLMVPALSVSVADNTSLELIGATFLNINTREGFNSEQLVYFANDVGQFYLSKQALIDLHIIPKDFPKVGSCDPSQAYSARGTLYEVQDEFPSVIYKKMLTVSSL